MEQLMKIGHPAAGIQEQAPSAPAAGRVMSDEQASRVPAAVASGSARVELSSAAASLLSGARGAPAEIDAAKVARISQAIADGSFRIDAEAIADKLIANAQEVLASVKR
jgi:negative regulator of flagellin synthesis FlgM